MFPIYRYLPAVALLLFTAANAEAPRSVTVAGTGIASVTPDVARVQLSVVERNPSLAAAQQAAAAVTARALKLTDRLGIERKLVNTTGAAVRPDYRWNREKEEQELLGYVVERNIEIELRDLQKLGELLEGAVQAGVNQLQPPVLDSSRRREIYREALALAAADATANATTLAAALDARLGAVQTIYVGDGSNPPPQPMRLMQADMAVAESAAQSYNAADIRFETTVTVVYSLE